MKAITLWQPWASMLACGAKQYETRSWATSYRGPIAIHAAAKPVRADIAGHDEYGFNYDEWLIVHDAIGISSVLDLPYGAIIATAELVECWECIGSDVRGDLMILKGRDTPEWDNAYLSDEELLFGNFEKGRYAWEFANMKMLSKPIPAKGHQRLWNWDWPEGLKGEA